MADLLPPRLTGDDVHQYHSTWIDTMPDTDTFFIQLKIDNTAPRQCRAALLYWSDGSFSKVNCPYTEQLILDSDAEEAAYCIGRAALERRHQKEVLS